jgi:hypothetical protein
VKKERERKANGEDREEEAQDQGGATSEGEADTQQARWQRSPQDSSRAHGRAQDGGAAQGRLTKRGPSGLFPFGRIAGLRSGRRHFRKTPCDLYATGVRAGKSQSEAKLSFKFSARLGADTRQWIPSSIPAKDKKCGLDATEKPKNLQNRRQNPILYQQIIRFCSL